MYTMKLEIPVQYEGKQYQWTAGRMLEGYTDESYKIAYTYDQSGLRQRKTIMDRDASAPVWNIIIIGTAICPPVSK